MCTIILIKDKSKEFPLIIASNRDEDFNRSFSPVQILSKDPLIIGGKDNVKGGTWLAVNKYSLFAAITNQGTPEDKPTSRGEIPLEILKCKSLDEMVSFAENLDPSKYNGFNVIFGNQQKVFIAQSYILPSMVVSEIPSGINIITSNFNYDGPYKNPKIPFIHEYLRGSFGSNSSWLNIYKDLKSVLSDRDNKVILRPRKKSGKHYGYCTQSSSILAFSDEGLARYKFYDRLAYKERAAKSQHRYNDYIELWKHPDEKLIFSSEENTNVSKVKKTTTSIFNKFVDNEFENLKKSVLKQIGNKYNE